jgi:recombination protein RecT
MSTDIQKSEKPKNRLAIIREYARSDEIKVRFSEIVGKNNASAYISSALIAVANSEQLQECSPQSILTSAMRAATLRLSCDPATKQAWLVPFSKRCTLIIGYMGLYNMAIRTGKYRYLHVATVWEGQTVEEDQLKGIHKIVGHSTASNPIGYMLYMELVNGYKKTVYMTVEEILAHAERYSKSFKKPESPWNTNRDEMCKKTVMRLGIIHWGYLDPYDINMIGMVDENGGSVEDEDWDRETEELPPLETIVTGRVEVQHRRSEAEILNDLGFDTSPTSTKIAPTPAPAAPNIPLTVENVRPYAPEVLRKELFNWSKIHTTDIVTHDQKMVISNILRTVLQDDDKSTKTNRLLDWLFKIGNVFDIYQPVLAAMLFSWLKPTWDSGGGAHVSKDVEHEILAAYVIADANDLIATIKKDIEGGQIGLPLQQQEELE